ncbi:hypothetical protein H4R26_004464 [Coemansia thaxteri]|uniref:Fork-head domain-containing protein n=1 Tax=Coemansia thaxteri TaxID=2663907 RepID=A0A9W8EI57_9FUNG|nr:hypothetical protein H4R26_004464 [Coemansia thaxteri]
MSTSSQQHSPALGPQRPAPISVSAVDINNPHFAYLKSAYPARPFSPSMDFANMNIASGYPTPHSATPVGAQPPPPQPQQLQAMELQPIEQHNDDDSTSISLGATADAASSPTAADQPSDEKPEYSYASLIAQSLIDAPTQRRTLNGIYEWIQTNFPYYRTRQNWQNSIRHNLSLNKGFMKMKRDEAHPGKGSFWTFTPGYEACLNAGHFKPLRSRSGRAALAAAAAMAAAKSVGDCSDSEAAHSPACQQMASASKKTDKKAGRAVKAAKSLKRSHSVPPKELSSPLGNVAVAQAGVSAAGTVPPSRLFSNSCGLAPASPSPLVHSDTMPVGGRKPAKKMRMSSSQSHMGLVSAMAQQPGVLSGGAVMSHPQTPFEPSPGYHHNPSPALVCATPMSVVSTGAHTPFQFQMQSPCSVSMPMPGMDMASVPSANAGPYMGAFVGPFGEPVGSMESVGYFGDSGGDGMYGSRRANMPSRISWHGPESMTQAFAGMHHPHSGFHMQPQPLRQANSLGVSMGMPEHGDVGFSMLGEGHPMAMGPADASMNQSPVDWAMFAGISAPPVTTDFPMHTPQLHHVSSVSSIDIHNGSSSSSQYHSHHAHSHIVGQPRVASLSAMEAAAPIAMASAGCEGSGSSSAQGFLSFYDEMLRDPSSLMSVLGQDLAGWQCPAKTNTIDPAALCAVDPDANAF